MRTPRRAPVRVAVIGGGIAGLASAHRLLELGAQRGIAIDVVLCEARRRLGGRIATERAGDYLIERGPDSFLTEKPWALNLCGRLGLDGHLIGTRAAHHRALIALAGRLHPLPEGFYLVAPTRVAPVLRSRLFSWTGKARMAMDLVLPRGPARDDESLGSFVARRLGREVLERVAQPMVAGIYTADAEALSLAATMPRLLEMERRHRSVIWGMLRGQAARRAGVRAQEPPASPFATLPGGMGELVDALALRLPSSAVRAGTRVLSIARAEGPAPRRIGAYQIAVEDGSPVEADGVILATEAHHAAGLVADLDPALSGLLRTISYASSAAVTLAYRLEQIARPIDGLGYVVPKTEGRPILACTFTSIKFPGRAPHGHGLFRVFIRGGEGMGMLEQDDHALAALAQAELATVLGISGPPRLVRIHRHLLAMPQYLVGHLTRVATIEARAAHHPALALAGAAYHGVGVPDCVRSGEAAAGRVLDACLGGALRA